MEINTTYPNQNTLASQGVSRDQKAGAIEELAERRKAANAQNQVERTEPSPSDTVSLSEESLKLAQTASVQNKDNQTRINSPEQAREAAGKFISDAGSKPDQVLYAVSNRASAGLRTLLS